MTAGSGVEEALRITMAASILGQLVRLRLRWSRCTNN